MYVLKPLVFSLESSVKRNLLGLELLAIVSQSDFSNPVKENIPWKCWISCLVVGGKQRSKHVYPGFNLTGFVESLCNAHVALTKISSRRALA